MDRTWACQRDPIARQIDGKGARRPDNGMLGRGVIGRCAKSGCRCDVDEPRIGMTAQGRQCEPLLQFQRNVKTDVPYPLEVTRGKRRWPKDSGVVGQDVKAIMAASLLATAFSKVVMSMTSSAAGKSCILCAVGDAKPAGFRAVVSTRSAIVTRAQPVAKWRYMARTMPLPPPVTRTWLFPADAARL